MVKLGDIIDNCFSCINKKYIRIHTLDPRVLMKAAKTIDTGIICTFDLKYDTVLNFRNHSVIDLYAAYGEYLDKGSSESAVIKVPYLDIKISEFPDNN